MRTPISFSQRASATRRLLLALIGVTALMAAACGGDDDTTASDPSSDDSQTAASAGTEDASTTTTTIATEVTTTTNAPTTTAAPTTAAPTTTVAATSTTSAAVTVGDGSGENGEGGEDMSDSEWIKLPGTEDCVCADGSDYSFWVREADPQRVVFYLQGGGACFSEASCSFTDGNFDVTVDESDDPRLAGGILDFENPRNPLADYSFVIAPYCTGDVHVGNSITGYSADLVVRHNGFTNASAALDELVERFSGASEVIVAGSSAGSAASPLYGGLVADALPDASVAVIADASGAYPSVPVVNATIGGLWGTESVIPDWPVNEGMTVQEWGLPDLFVQAGRHAPHIRFARYDNAFDSTQEFFASLAGFDASSINELMALNEAKIEAAGVSQASYTAPGDDHTILLRDLLYTVSVDGVAFLDWLVAFLAGADVEDVLCSDCG